MNEIIKLAQERLNAHTRNLEKIKKDLDGYVKEAQVLSTNIEKGDYNQISHLQNVANKMEQLRINAEFEQNGIDEANAFLEKVGA